jgi:tetratricopeptide (TPR) repeat protein
MRFVATAAAIAVLVTGSAPSTRADTLPGSSRAREALALCDAAARRPDDATRSSLLERGLALAEAAVSADPADAAGHFAIFCTLGRRVQFHPLSWRSLGAVRRARRAIDRALALAPNSPQVLTAKGIMLLELPRLLGGDADEGGRLLRRALEVAPGFAAAERAIAEYGVALPAPPPR